MKIKSMIIVATMAAAIPFYAMAGEVKDDMNQTGSDISETAKDTGSAIKQDSRDASLTTKVKTALAQEKDLSSMKIHVASATGGIVTLTGTVKSAAQSQQAANAAMGVEGVTQVKNKLKVKS